MSTPDPSPATSSGRGRLPSLEKYELIEEIGHGGMATVYRARDPRLSRDVAVKIIHPHLRESKEVAHRFSVEAQAVAKLRHPNIVEVFDVSGPNDPEQYLVTELLHGRTLRKVLQERGKLPPEVAAALGIELLSALAHAHEQGIVHRDVKPENVFLEHPALAGPDAPTSGGKSIPGSSLPPSARPRIKVKLMDFGIAKLLDAQGVTSTGQVLGSPAHMAPEQIEGGDVDGRSDVFPLGVLLYECMVGHLPFEGTNPAQVLRRVLDGNYAPAEQEEPRVGKFWSVMLDRALAREPSGRWEDCLVMKEALEHELARVGVTEPLRDLDAWCADHEAYQAAHDKQMVQKLAELGGAARKRHDALGAASDYNRALAYAPDDANLLKVVSGMRRSEARARMIRRAAPIVLVMLGVCGVTFFIARAIREARNHPVVTQPTASKSTTVPSASATTSSSAPAPVTSPSSIHVPLVRTVTPPVASTRTVTLARVSPLQGVLWGIDEAAPTPAQSSDSLTIDTAHEHTIVFTCKLDLCIPDRRTIGVGTKDESLTVDMRIRPAVLVVEGEPGKSYAIVEYPAITVTVGVGVPVPATSGADFDVTVKELGSDRSKPITLHPGQSSTVSFR
jgi:serine/threonine-protein kinase